MNSLVQSASAGSRPACPEEEAESPVDKNSAAQSPDSARAATSGAEKRKYIVISHLNKLKSVWMSVCAHYLSVVPVCSSVDLSAAFPPAVDPCQNCEEAVVGPVETHWPAGFKKQQDVTKNTGHDHRLLDPIQTSGHRNWKRLEILKDQNTHLLFRGYFNWSRRNLWGGNE